MSNMNKVLGFERINERVKRPNALINFIKPLEGPHKALAQDFLERVAAICYPIMKENHIVVMALEEFPPNLEFVGRNFNAGEVIQLVLKAPHTGEWLPFKHVQMVMMHELAHCKQMNHSRAFWKVRNTYADELRVLWGKDYTGEGLWGRGQSLISGQYMTDHMPEAANAPANLCGGTYRSSGGRKRKRKEDKPKITYAERQQRRIAKKFGVNGVTLGDDEGVRAKLEAGQKGKKPAVKPRVAGSNRGRELRAAAALARFETAKKDAVKEESKTEPKMESTSDDDYETDSDYEYSHTERTMNPEDGNMVRVCENEDSKDENAQREFDELREIDRAPSKAAKSRIMQPPSKAKINRTTIPDDSSTESEGEQDLDALRRFKQPPEKQQHKKPHAIPDDVSTDSEDEIEDITSAVEQKKKQQESKKSTNKATTRAQSKQLGGASKKTHPISIDADDASTASEGESGTTVLIPGRGQLEVPSSTIDNAVASSSTTVSSGSSHQSLSSVPASIQISAACPICSLENEPTAALCAACSHVLNPRLMPNSWKCQSSSCSTVGYVNPADYGVCGLCGATKPN